MLKRQGKATGKISHIVKVTVCDKGGLKVTESKQPKPK